MKQISASIPAISPFRVVVLLLAAPLLVVVFLLLSGVVLRMLGFELNPERRLRVGMSMENVREILGDPEGRIKDETRDNKQREDWWYSNRFQMQLTFIDGRLSTNHSKDHLRE